MLDTSAKTKVVRDSNGLRDALFDEIDGLRDGTRDAQSAITVANLAKQIVNVVKAETEFHALVTSGKLSADVLNQPLKLGSK